MSDTKLTHHSRPWADLMLAAIMGEQSIDENRVRQIMFDCYCHAFIQGTEKILRSSSYHQSEDMGR